MMLYIVGEYYSTINLHNKQNLS